MSCNQSPSVAKIELSEKEPFTREDAQVIRALHRITSKGNNAEVRQNKDGNLLVYEVKKNKVAVGQ